MAWWGWVILGFALLGGEMLTPGGFFLFFFGVGALLVGALVGMSMLTPEWAQWATFAVLSAVSLVLFRQRLLQLLPSVDGKSDRDGVVGEEAVALETIGPAISGKVELRGAGWRALNVGKSAIDKSSRCKVVNVDGLTLHVEEKK